MAFGYPGDSTPDSASAVGTGAFAFDDPARGGTPMVALQDAALKKADAENIYHVQPGETFVNPADGKTYRYADVIPDWSPAKPGYVDVYDPNHPPDPGHGGNNLTYRQGSGKSDNGANTNTGDMGGEDVTPAPDPTSVEAADPTKQSEKPTDVLGPDFMLQQIRQQHPQYGHDDNDTILKALQDKYPAPIQQLRAIFPQYKDVKDSDLMEGVRRKFYPELSEKDFQEKLQPPNPVVAAVTDYFQQFPERDLWKNIVQSFHTGMGGIEKFPERAAEGLDWLAKQDWLKGALKPMPGAKGYEQGIRGGIKRLYEAGQEQAKRGKLEQAQLPNTPGIAGKANAIAGQIIGGTPEAVVSFLPGVGPAAAVTIGMTYNAVTAFGDAQERGKDNALGQAFEAGGVRAVQQWILDTPRGRILSGVYNAVLSMGDEQARKFMNGDPDNDVDRTAANGALSFVLGVISARGPKEQLPEASRIYFDKVEQARGQGNTEEALQLMDKGLLMLSDGDRNQLGQLMLNWRDDTIPLLNDKPKALMAPRGPRETPTEPSGPVIQRPYRTKEELRPLPYNPEAARPSELQKKEFAEPTSPPTPKESTATFDEKMTDQFYYSGFAAAPQMVSDLVMKELPRARAFAVKTVKPHTDVWHRAWDPENIGENYEKAGAVIAQQNAMYRTERQRLMQNLIHKMKLENSLQFAYDKDRRQSFWKTFTKVQQKTFAEAADEGRTTHNWVVDRMIQINRKGTEAIYKMDDHHGIHYPFHDTYLYRVLKRPEDAAKLERLISMKRWGDPGFMKAREIPDLATLHKFGFELKTYNQEELFQMRLDDSLRARSRVVALENLAKDGLAITAKDLKGVPKGLQEQVMMQSTDVRSPNGTHYWVHNEANFMLHRAWDPTPRGGPWEAMQKFVLNPLNLIKQKTVGIRLGLSLWHQNHMLDLSAASTLASVEGKFLAGKGTGKDLMDAFGAVWKSMSYVGGVREQFKITKGYSNLLAFYEGKIGFDQLTPEEQWQQQYQRMGGLSPVVSHERQEQFITMLNKHVPVIGRIADPLKHIGYVLTGGPYQPWLFKRVIPSLKMAAFDRETEALFNKSPWLMNPENESKLRLELHNIGKKVDVRFGELNYDNLFWDKTLKLTGQTFSLSLGWKLGGWRMYAGAVHTLLDNASHMDEIVKTVQKEGVRPAAQRVFTNELLYAANYSALTSIKNLLVTAVFGGAGAVGTLTLMDAIYPRIGTDNKGNPIRLKAPYWQGELGSIYESMQQKGPMEAAWNYFKNSTQPALNDLAQIGHNKDYRGTEIIGKHDGLANQMGELGAFVLTQNVPFSVESGILRPKPGATWAERILPFFGMPPAPAWTARTDAENNIINAYAARQGDRTKSRQAQERTDARTELRDAIQSKDQKRIDEATAKGKAVGLSDLSIKDTYKTVEQTTGQRLLHKLDPEEQEQMLRDMAPDERAKYLPFASKSVRAKLLGEN